MDTADRNQRYYTTRLVWAAEHRRPLVADTRSLTPDTVHRPEKR